MAIASETVTINFEGVEVEPDAADASHIVVVEGQEMKPEEEVLYDIIVAEREP